MKQLLTIIIVLAIAAGGWYWYSNYYAPVTPSVEAGANNTPEGGSGIGVDVNASATLGAPTSATVTLSADGFSPKSVTVKKGGSVTFVNESAGQMWVASAQHPTHTTYSGTTLEEHCDEATDTSFDQCKNGGSYSFTFDKVGTWNFHNHLVNGQYGSVVVVE